MVLPGAVDGADLAWSTGMPVPPATPPDDLAALQAEVSVHPEDYAPRIDLAWALYRAGRSAEALAHYEAAAALSGGAALPRLGALWCRLALGQDIGAGLRALRAEHPDADGLPALQRAWRAPRWDASVTLGAASLGVSRDGLVSAGGRGSLAFGSRKHFVAVHAGLAGHTSPGATSSTASTGRFGPPWASDPPAEEPEVTTQTWLSEVWLRGGARTARTWVTGAVARLGETGLPAGWLAGARVETGADDTVAVEASLTRGTGGWDVARIAPSVRVSSGALAARPEAALLWDGERLKGTLGGTLEVTRPAWAGWIGGRAGRERHTTEISVPATVRWADTVDAVGWGGVRLGEPTARTVTVGATLHHLVDGDLWPAANLTLHERL